MKKFVVLDANVLLDFYTFPADELRKLREILAREPIVGEVQFLLVPHVINEWKKNRGKNIQNALKQFRKDLDTIRRLSIPTVIKYSKHYEDIDKARAKLKTASEAAIQGALEAAIKNNLAADKLIQRIMNSADTMTYKYKLYKIQDNALSGAYRRTILGYPPGKPNELGDRFIWETLLQAEFLKGQDVYIITNDRDYYSPFEQKDEVRCEGVNALKNANMQANEYLREEWRRKKQGELYVLQSIMCLLELLGAPDVQDLLLSRRRRRAVIKLIDSWSFKQTHSAIEELLEYSEYTEGELIDMMTAYLENDQIYQICSDTDVKDFGYRLVELAKMYPDNQEMREIEKKLTRMIHNGCQATELLSEDH